MRTTLKQVADAANLSITIVSQVLNNKPCRVSKENRKRIVETAERLNYRPNLVAVSLVHTYHSSRTGKILCGLCWSHNACSGELALN